MMPRIADTKNIVDALWKSYQVQYQWEQIEQIGRIFFPDCLLRTVFFITEVSSQLF
jgi:hypothetical protein